VSVQLTPPGTVVTVVAGSAELGEPIGGKRVSTSCSAGGRSVFAAVDHNDGCRIEQCYVSADDNPGVGGLEVLPPGESFAGVSPRRVVRPVVAVVHQHAQRLPRIAGVELSGLRRRTVEPDVLPTHHCGSIERDDELRRLCGPPRGPSTSSIGS
jgi:hypothetical protein